MTERSPVRKAVIAAAGFGTRFLPQTKAMPKEMLPLVDKPIIQYIVEELVEAGIQDIIIVTGYSKRTIEDHFDYPNQDLINNLHAGGQSKAHLLQEVEAIANLANFAYIRQKGPYGNAMPILNAEHLIGDEPFIFAFADDFVVSSPSRFRQLLAVRDERGGSVLTCLRAQSDEDYKRYGFVGGETESNGILKINTIIEKPGSRQASPSDLASVSGYVLDPALFAYLHQAKDELKEGEEFIMQPSLQQMSLDGHSVYGCEVQNGKFYDTGNKLEYLKTVVDFALQRDDIKAEFGAYLRKIIQP